MRHVVFNSWIEIIIHKFKIIKIDIASQTHPTAKSFFFLNYSTVTKIITIKLMKLGVKSFSSRNWNCSISSLASSI